MKSFDHFLLEVVSDEEYEARAEKEKLDEKGTRPTRKGIVSRSFKNAMSALNRGDIERHRYWMRKAYHKLTGKQENG